MDNYSNILSKNVFLFFITTSPLGNFSLKTWWAGSLIPIVIERGEYLFTPSFSLGWMFPLVRKEGNR